MNSIAPVQAPETSSNACAAEVINDRVQHKQQRDELRTREPKFYVDLRALTDRDFGRRRRMPSTCADLYTILDYFDAKGWHWEIVSDTNHAAKKEAWCKQFMYPRNKLRLLDDHTTVADASTTFVSRDVNKCRLFCAAGGRAIWVDQGRLFAVSDDQMELLKPSMMDLVQW